MALLIAEHEVDSLLNMAAAMEVVEEAFKLQGEGSALNLPRRRVSGGHSTVHIMGGALPGLDLIGIKAYVTGPTGVRFVVNLYRESTGEPLAIIEADRLGQLRTGAASGVSAKYLAREDAQIVGVFGSGRQARTQLQAVAAARKLAMARVFSRDAEHRRAFGREMSVLLGINVAPTADPEQVAREADVIITATSSAEPVLKGEWIRPGTHVIAMGANRMTARELDDVAMESFDLIAVDDIEQSKLESLDLAAPIERGAFGWEDLVHLGDVAAGKVPGRLDVRHKTLFKSLGIGLWDVAVAGRVYQAARARGLGTEIPMFAAR